MRTAAGSASGAASGGILPAWRRSAHMPPGLSGTTTRVAGAARQPAGAQRCPTMRRRSATSHVGGRTPMRFPRGTTKVALLAGHPRQSARCDCAGTRFSDCYHVSGSPAAFEKPGSGSVTNNRRHGLASHRAHRAERARALSVAMPVFAYICRYSVEISRTPAWTEASGEIASDAKSREGCKTGPMCSACAGGFPPRTSPGGADTPSALVRRHEPVARQWHAVNLGALLIRALVPIWQSPPCRGKAPASRTARS
jgi:hypothetical protein